MRACGRVTAQDEASSVVFGMARAAIEAGLVDEVPPLGELAARLAEAQRGGYSGRDATAHRSQ